MEGSNSGQHPTEQPTTSNVIVGAFIGGDNTVHGDMNVFVNDQPSTSQAAAAAIAVKKTPFRCNLPSPSPQFQGRRDILYNIFVHFKNASTPMTDCWGRMVTVAGMGGIGKSETAFKFAEVHSETYPCVALIDAETECGALESFLRLAKSLEIEDTKEANVDLVRRVYDHIDKHYCHHNVLLIFDNAIQLQSDDNEFGIFDYLPTTALCNKRFPFVIITSQTTDWQPGITTFELDELKVKPSVSFFRSTFKIKSDECDEDFKELHRNLQGHPLAMTLAASNIDFDPTKDTVNWLKNEIKEYVDKFKNEDSSILTERINKNWPSKYNKTLSTVWKLSLKRLQAAPNGPNALIVLKAVSFYDVPLTQDDLRCVFIECPYCRGTPDWMKNASLIKSIRLLRKFHLVDSIFQDWDHSNELNALKTYVEISPEDLPRVQKQVQRAKTFKCELRIHRLVQLVVRLDTDCSVVLDDILRYLAFWTNTYVRQLNTPAVEEALGRRRLSTRALAFVGLLALKGNLAAQRIVQTRSPRSDPAATIWRVLQLDKNIETLNEEALQVLSSFIGLSTSEKSLIDKRCFARKALKMFYPKIILSYAPNYETSAQGLKLKSFAEIQDIARELLSTGCSFNDVCSLPELCVNTERSNAATYTLLMGSKIIEDLAKAKKPEAEIAQVKEQLGTYRDFVDRGKDKFPLYREELREIFVSDDSWNKFQSEVESCGLDQLKLKQVFSSYFDKIWLATEKTNFNYSTRLCYYFTEVDGLVYGYLLTWRSREELIPLMESFTEILVKRDNKQSSVLQTLKENEVFVAVWICSTWVTFCLQETHLSSTDLSTSFSRILTAIKNVPTYIIPDLLQCFNDCDLLRTRHKLRYDVFLEIHSESTEEEIRALVPFCRNIQNKINGYCN